MRLTRLQKILWAAAGAAMLAYGVLMVLPSRVPVEMEVAFWGLTGPVVGDREIRADGLRSGG